MNIILWNGLCVLVVFALLIILILGCESDRVDRM